jgi:hypothetical protein
VPGCLLAGTTFEITKQDRQSVSRWQTVELFVERRRELLAVGRAIATMSHRGRPSFELAMPKRVGASPRRGAAGDPVKPGPERIADPERPSLANQHEKGRLEGVHGRMIVAQDCAASAEDKRTVALDQNREGKLAPLAGIGREPFQKLSVGQFRCNTNVE